MVNISVHDIQRIQKVEPTLGGLNTLTEISQINLVFEIDITYLEHLHDEQYDLPSLPNNIKTTGLIVKNLKVKLKIKNNYIIHYQNLYHMISHGLIDKNICYLI